MRGLDYMFRAEKRADSKAWREARWQKDWVLSSGCRGGVQGEVLAGSANTELAGSCQEGWNRAPWRCSVC